MALPATDAKELADQVFGRWQSGIAILNCLYGVQLLFSEDMAAAFCRALNDYIAKEWLDRDPRLRASIVIPMQNIEYAVDEIERCAKDKRFVQVLVLAMQEVPLGRRHFWPIYAACERHGLPLGIHAGSAYRNPVTALGWPTWYIEDYAAQAQGFQSQMASLITEGVLAKHPGLKVVLIESGVTWLPGFLWRFGKFWRGLRTEVPWVDRAPWEIVRDHFRLTIQPFDAPDDPQAVERAIEHLRSDDILLYASDYPHWQFDGDDVVPAGLFAGAAAQDRDRQSARDLRPAEGGRAMNIEVRAKERAQHDQARHRRLRFPSQAHARADAAVPQQSMVELSPDLRQPLAPRLLQGLRLSEDDAAGGAP